MKIMICFLSLLTLTAHGAVTTTISRVEGNEVFAGNGRVYQVDSQDSDLVEELDYAKETGAEVNLELEEGVPFSADIPEKILEVMVGPTHAPTEPDVEDNLHPMSNYEPTNVPDLALANEMFGKLKDRTKIFTQCFNRAHIWARQMHKDYGVKSMKILIYYTEKYRNEVDKKWWFHIAPMVNVNGQKYVMDREFTKSPVTDVSWESIFTQKMRSKGIGPADYRCKKIENIGEYYQENNPDYCNIQHTSMYYWEPNDMERLEIKGTPKTAWINWELKAAARGVWWGWSKIYNEYKVQE